MKLTDTVGLIVKTLTFMVFIVKDTLKYTGKIGSTTTTLLMVIIDLNV